MEFGERGSRRGQDAGCYARFGVRLEAERHVCLERQGLALAIHGSASKFGKSLIQLRASVLVVVVAAGDGLDAAGPTVGHRIVGRGHDDPRPTNQPTGKADLLAA
eukprot:SAG31_NODE_2356_length_5874_cov_17.280000_9_plen_105_part_00